jgi:hypothetical protein
LALNRLLCIFSQEKTMPYNLNQTMINLKKIFLFLCAAIISGCSISPEQLGISKEHWKQYDKQEQERIISGHKYISQTIKKNIFAAPGNSCLKITIKNGHAIMPPFTDSYNFIPATFTLREGTCKNTTLYAVNSNKHTSIWTCYSNDVLQLDPSSYEIDKRYGTVNIYHSLLWNDGFNYTGINSNGYTRLQHATIFIKKQKSRKSDPCTGSE